ncbi:MAG TPA: carboxypeptidase regulatory-like domain-containing protein [Pyrinomonadaceae bacterium]|jgi:hypothetical protein|nr:carboxypeptidase regulatory-like domain-containing protein [Pyrinomonadaceae bacterium]
MRPSSISVFALLVAILLAFTGLSAGQDIRDDLKKPYVPSSYQALSGTITFTGKRPKVRIIDTSADPICQEVNPTLSTADAEGNEGRLANVLIYVESESLKGYEFPLVTAPAVLEHRGCNYAPRLLGVRVGQPLVILNSDTTAHNTHPQPQNNPEWNQTQPPSSPPLVKTFKRPEKVMPFRCNQHPWEKAFVSVFDHPFFAVSDAQGSFRIEGLPPGQYRVVAWHERFGEKSVDITFLPGEARDLTFEFTAAER